MVPTEINLVYLSGGTVAVNSVSAVVTHRDSQKKIAELHCYIVHNGNTESTIFRCKKKFFGLPVFVYCFLKVKCFIMRCDKCKI